MDETIKALDNNLDVLKNTKYLEDTKITLKLADDVNIDEFRRIIKELEDIKTASVHSIDTYHRAYNTTVKGKLERYFDEYRGSIRDGLSEKDALNISRPKIINFLNKLNERLLNGKIEL